ncbi:hypothetical protein UFOVP328_75 [uncultured Caudovirales phage]|uniref:Uncharacterized protein n=1 Tax=uncultured Caudovirales phage TaxID=2100421 RepID=A0A6J5LYE3_9CAUD|nr:hypothetical protein UFOVP328_75 [uncultured Caudovirales phage]
MWQIHWMLQIIPDSLFVWITYALFLLGAGAYIASKLVTWLPMMGRYRLPAELAGVVVLMLASYFYGQVSYRQAIAELKQKIAVAEQQSKTANAELERRTQQHIKEIREVKNENKRIVRETVGRQIDSQCTLPNSAVSLHNSASRNEISRGASSTDGTPSTVKASELIETVVDNYGACHENAERLRGWQEWYRTQKKIFESIK